MILTTTSLQKTFYYTLHATGYREKTYFFHCQQWRARLLWLQCVFHHGGVSGLRGSWPKAGNSCGFLPYRAQTGRKLHLPTLPCLTGCLNNSDLILQLLWNFLSLTSFNYCNSTSQSKKPWNFFYMCLQEQGLIIMQSFRFFLVALHPSFPTDEGCIAMGYVSTFCLKRSLNARTQVGAVGAQHFPAGIGTSISPGWWVSWL